MREQRILVIQTRKITSYNSGGAPVIERIDNKQVVGQSYEKFCKYIGSHGYMSAELIKVTDVVIDEKGKETPSEVTGKGFEEEKAKLMEILKEKKIQYGTGKKIEPFFNQEALDQIDVLKDKAIDLASREEDIKSKEETFTQTQQENEELKTKVAAIGGKDTLIEQQAQELKELKAKIAKSAAPPVKALVDMLADELKDYIEDKGYLINLNQNKADLLKAIQDEESKNDQN